MKNNSLKEINKAKRFSFTKKQNQQIKEYFPLKISCNIQNKKTSDKTYLNSLTINNKDSLSSSKNKSVISLKNNRIILYPLNKALTAHPNKSNSKKKSKNKKKRNKKKNIIINEKSNSINQKIIETTKKIDYRFFKYYPIKNIFSYIKNDNDNNKEYYWLATYDKLIKKKKIFKIFSFYNIATRDSIALGNEGVFNDFMNIKEKKMIIKDYELYFIEKFNKPFIRKCEGKYIYTKLYLLSLKQINMIFSYLNRIEYNSYISNLNNIFEKNTYKKISDLENNKDCKDINYSAIYCLGNYMNIKILGFSRIENENEIKDNYNIGVDNYPNSKKIAKLIKLLMINFPENTKEHYINYIFSDSHNNGLNKKMLTDKKNEINHLLISKKKALYKANSKNNSIMQSIISGIPEFSFSPYFSSNTYNNKINSNLQNLNIINSNKLGTISYNASCFDFTSDFFNSLKQNDEALSKALESMRSFSNQNNKNLNLYNNYTSNKGDIKKIGNDAKISNFSFENGSKISGKYIKIDISNRNNSKGSNNSFKNIKTEAIKNSGNSNFNLSNLSKKNEIKIKLNKNISKTKNSILKNNINVKNSKNPTGHKNYSINTQSILEDNKENYNSVSNNEKSIRNSYKIKNISEFTIMKMKKYLNKKSNSKKLLSKKTFINNSSSNNKSYLRGEDIFKTTNERNLKNLPGIIKFNMPNGIKSSDYKTFKKNTIQKLTTNFSIKNLK